MSLTRNNRVRCDWCGKLSSDRLGGYQAKDGTYRYIRAAGDGQGVPEAPPDKDMCDDCATSRTGVTRNNT